MIWGIYHTLYTMIHLIFKLAATLCNGKAAFKPNYSLQLVTNASCFRLERNTEGIKKTLAGILFSIPTFASNKAYFILILS